MFASITFKNFQFFAGSSDLCQKRWKLIDVTKQKNMSCIWQTWLFYSLHRVQCAGTEKLLPTTRLFFLKTPITKKTKQNVIFSSTKSQYFFAKISGIGPWVRRALMWLNLYGRQAVWRKLKKRGKNAFFVFVHLFWAYVRQPDDHIGWGTSMPFASIYPIHLKISQKNIENWRSWKMAFFGFFKKKMFVFS